MQAGVEFVSATKFVDHSKEYLASPRYIVLNTERFSRLWRGIKTRFRFSVGQPVHRVAFQLCIGTLYSSPCELGIR